MLKELAKIKVKDYGTVFILALTLVFFLVSAFLNYKAEGNEEYALLSKSFLDGKLYLYEPRLDSVLYNDHYYWHLGPFPAVALMPLTFIWKILFNQVFRQGFLYIIITFGIFTFSYWLAKKFKYSFNDSLYLAFAFCFASVYQFVAFIPWSWYFGQAITTLLLFFSIHEYFTKKRYLLIGIYLGFVLLSRYTAVFCVLFYLAIIQENKNDIKSAGKKLFKLCTPILIAGLLLMWYNYERFENPLNSGYADSNNWLYSEEERYEQINYGLFQLRNIPTNFFYYFLNGVQPIRQDIKSLMGTTYMLKTPYVTVSYPGTSLFVVAPIFLYVFKNKFKSSISKKALIPVLVITFILLTYYWPGWRQIGPRYTLDFAPFLYLILLEAFENRKLTKLAKYVIVISSLYDYFFFLHIFNLY